MNIIKHNDAMQAYRTLFIITYINKFHYIDNLIFIKQTQTKNFNY